MRRGLVAFIALTLVGLGLTGCGLFRYEQREPWRSQAEEACLAQGLVQPSAYMAHSSRVDGPGACGMDYPFKVAAFSGGSVGLRQKVTLACPIIPRIDGWLEEVVKPAALLHLGTAVVDIRASAYSCRSRNNQRGAKLSEHSFGNALDVMGFHLADGREVTVLNGWRGPAAEQAFLREVFVGACRHFTTVLGPGADMFHYDHFHFDLARHDPYGQRRLCKPVIKYTPRLSPLDPGLARGRAAPAELPPIEFEEDLSDEEALAAARQMLLGPRGAGPGARPPRGGFESGLRPVPRFEAAPLPPSGVPRPGPAEPNRRQPIYNRPPPVPHGGPMVLQPGLGNGHGLY